MKFTKEQKDKVSAYLALIIVHADICRGFSNADDAMLLEIKKNAKKLSEYLTEIDNGTTK